VPFVEGAPASPVVIAVIPDPSQTTPPSPAKVAIDWGDGSPLETQTGQAVRLTPGLLTVLGSHSYAPVGAPAGSIHVTTQAKGSLQSTPVPFQATVVDAPLSAVGVPVTIDQGVVAPDVVVATFSDQGGPQPAGKYSVTIDWGDGTAPSAGVVSGGRD